MEKLLISRPSKKPLPQEEQLRLRSIAVTAIKGLLLPNPDILKIVLIGSSVKATFGQYDPPGFRGSLFSDFDFIVYVKDDYLIPSSLEQEPDGKPFADAELNLAYRVKNFVEGTFDAEIFFVREGSLQNEQICTEGERAGIPMNNDSQHAHLVIFTHEGMLG